MKVEGDYNIIYPIELRQRSINRMLIGGFAFSWIMAVANFIIIETPGAQQIVLNLIFLVIPLRLLIGTLFHNGLVYQNNTLYRAKILENFVFSKKEIKVANAHDVVILRYNISTVPNWHYVKGNGLVNFTHVYEVHLLNEKHSNRNCILSFNKRVNAEKAAEFIERHSNLFYSAL